MRLAYASLRGKYAEKTVEKQIGWRLENKSIFASAKVEMLIL